MTANWILQAHAALKRAAAHAEKTLSAPNVLALQHQPPIIRRDTHFDLVAGVTRFDG